MAKKKLTDFAAVIFDLDGLVLDTEKTFRIAWKNAAHAMGYTLSERFCVSLSGLTFDTVATKLQQHYGVGFDITIFNTLSSHCWHTEASTHGIPIKAGFNALLATIMAHRIPFCLATNSNAANAQQCLAYAGLAQTFNAIVSHDDVEQGKPAPDIFLTAAIRLNVNITECLILEDSYTGVIAGKRAGAFVVWVSSTDYVNGDTLAHCHLNVKDLTAVLETFCT